MASGQWAVVLRHVQRLFQGGSVSGLTEGQLLERFVSSRDEFAFGAIVARHGPMVLGVCRGVLDDPHDVEDAFQATFLVLVRKAAGLRDRERLAQWLYGVARRRVAPPFPVRGLEEGERAASESPEVEAGSAPVASFDAELRELQVLVREEVDRLPSNDRMAVVFCYLEGLTHEEAADRLGWPVGTVKGRLSRARDKLRDRLGRRGGRPAHGLRLEPWPRRSWPAVPPSTDPPRRPWPRADSRPGRPLTAGIVSAHAISLREGVIGTMFTTKLKIAAVALVATCAAAVPGVMAFQEVAPTDEVRRSSEVLTAACPEPSEPSHPEPADSGNDRLPTPIPTAPSRRRAAGGQLARIRLAEQAPEGDPRAASDTAGSRPSTSEAFFDSMGPGRNGRLHLREERLKVSEGRLARMEQALQSGRPLGERPDAEATPSDVLDA